MNDNDIKKRILEAAHKDVPDLKRNILAQAHIRPEKRSFLSYFKRHTTQFASLLLVILISGFLLLNLNDNGSGDTISADSTIYMDINPSFEIDVDEEDNIIALRAINTDAEHLIDLLNDYEGHNVHSVIDDIIDLAINENYLNNENPYVMIDVKGRSSLRETTLMETIETRIPEHAQSRMPNIQMIRGNAQNPTDEEQEAAHDHHMSMMKLRTIESILALTEDYTFEDLETRTTGELIQIYKSLSNDDSTSVPPRGRPDSIPQ
ncbi:MAG: anti-sigma-I factor RsgI family protein [Bacillota bacterium]